MQVKFKKEIKFFFKVYDIFRLLNDEWAFEKAKSNVERYFPVVGILEELNVTLQMFERKIPYFFRGAQKLYYKDILRKF